MSCVCILTPIVIAGWPAFSAAVIAAAASLGYQVASEAANLDKAARGPQKSSSNVQLEIENSEVVTNQLGRDQRITVSKARETVTLSRDTRCKVSLCVSGGGHSNEELAAKGQELSQAVVQQYVYRNLMDEMPKRG